MAIIGLAHVVKHIIHCKECRGLRGWHKIKVEEEKPTGETVSHKIEVEEEKKQGSRYGSNPIHY
ncbi:hypothetical protein [Methanosarcina horonobensis]|uniref:hypothetical protein n=1 Tax=Methanosarcina horonobensis TaxID=418008 RepID=UPI0022B85D61|nr:hypothetical protein [Methanosarcina horonobensis]